MDNRRKNQIPKFDEMFLPILKALKNLGGRAPLDSLDQEAIRIMSIPKQAEMILHADGRHGTEVRYRLAWARTYLKKYGLIINPQRGVWCFSDAFDGNIDNIDSGLIVKTVRDQNLKAFKDAAISDLEATSAFEHFALSALQDYARAKSIPIVLGEQHGKVHYDAVLPRGISGNGKPTYVEVRFSLSGANVKGDFERVVAGLGADECFLLILGDQLPAEEKRRMTGALARCALCSVMLWDYDDLLTYVDRESDYIGFLSTPRKALAEEAILRAPDDREQQKLKRQRIERLRQAYQSENLILCLGAGVSKDAGIPLWNDLIHELLVLMINHKTQEELLGKAELERISQLAASNQEESPLTQVRYIRAAFEEEESADYYEIVRSVLYGKKVNMESALLNAIGELARPERNHVGVKGVITYNFDDLLELKLYKKGIRYNVVYREKDPASTSALNIYHVHGFLPQHLTEGTQEDTALIFSEEDYHEVYRDAYCWSNITQLNAFREHVCLFIGCSLTDPNLRRLLDIAARSSDFPRHFAIMKRKMQEKPQADNVRDRRLLKIYQRIDNSIREAYFRTLGINVIWVDDFTEIPKILNSLVENDAGGSQNGANYG